MRVHIPRVVLGRAALAVACLLMASPTVSVFAHARPLTSRPQPGARLGAAPEHIAITYDDPIDPSGSSLVLLDGSGAAVPVVIDLVAGSHQASISPMADLQPGPYTVGWNSLDATDGHDAHGFFTFVVNGGNVGIISGLAQTQAPAADLVATLTVTANADGGSLLRVDLNDSTAVERVRIRLLRSDLGESLLDTHPSGDGGWVLDGNEVAVPGAWQAEVVVRRTNVFDDARAMFDFSVDPLTGAPAFGQL
jgi:methionine-rich copper-binding protein CopC